MRRPAILLEKSNCIVAAFSKGDIFNVEMLNWDLSYIENFVSVKHREDSSELTAKIDILAVVNKINIDENGNHCGLILFIRADRKKEERCGNIHFAEFSRFSRLQEILKYDNSKKAIPGFKNAIIYDDEIAVPECSIASHSGWIIYIRDVSGYMKLHRILDDEEEIK